MRSREKRSAAEGKAHVDVGFWGGAVPDDLGHLRELHDAGVFGFKCFLCPSGVDEFGSLELEQLGAAAAEIAAFDGLLIVHAELPEPIERATRGLGGCRPVRVPHVPELSASGGGGGGDRGRRRGERGDRVPDPRAPPLGGDRSRRPGAPRRAHVGRDLPALPDVRGRGDPRRRDRVQVRAPDPRSREPGTAVGGPAGRADRRGRVRPLAVHRRPEGGLVLRRVGWHRVGGARAPGRVDRRLGPAGSRSRTWPGG